ncbi:hypothetical protein BofuT4_uP156820.1 [Botrytis cinerea T4]|uniref:Uncharacterized protein n=1 Tax=Botryotinia fuckeliana (strain T4) TaxID=999810 RepID=G2YUI8_BOTF4|nr:hypothetical protein BofuT4_uP156820.1 [Botrytis cinerea T4]
MCLCRHQKISLASHRPHPIAYRTNNPEPRDCACAYDCDVAYPSIHLSICPSMLCRSIL